MATHDTGAPAPSGRAIASQLSPYIRDKTVLITGVSPGGLGAQFALTIAAAAPALLILAGRSEAKCAATAADISAAHPAVATRVLSLDLASQADVRRAAAEIIAAPDVPAIDALVLNAGIMATPWGRTVDGLEMQFGANYVGHWLFANLLMPKVLKGTSVGPDGAAVGAGRVVSVSSDGIRLGPIRFADLDFAGGEAYDRWRAYGQSKTGNCLYAVSLAAKLGVRGLVALSVHPGVITTNLGAHVDSFADLFELDRLQGDGKGGFARVTLDQGVATHVFAAFSPEAALHNGAYCDRAAVPPPSEVRCWARDSVDAERLWKLTEGLVGQEFAW